MTAPSASAPPTAVERKPLLVAADQLLCPACRQPLRRIHPGEGSLLITCANKLDPVRGKSWGEVCGQHIYIATGGKGYANIIAINEDEYTILSAGRVVPAPADALTILGVLTARTPDALPTYPCAKCRTQSKLNDLFGGHCRQCAGIVPRAP